MNDQSNQTGPTDQVGEVEQLRKRLKLSEAALACAIEGMSRYPCQICGHEMRPTPESLTSEPGENSCPVCRDGMPEQLRGHGEQAVKARAWLTGYVQVQIGRAIYPLARTLGIQVEPASSFGDWRFKKEYPDGHDPERDAVWFLVRELHLPPAEVMSWTPSRRAEALDYLQRQAARAKRGV